MNEIWQKMIEFFTEKGVSTGLAIAYIIVSALLVVMAIVALIMWIIVCVKYFAANKTRTTSGKTGLELAREMLDKAGLKHIQVKKAGLLRAIFIGNCYSITKKTVFLRGAIANKNSTAKIRVYLDIAGYREKRIKTLEELALKIARTVVRTRKQIVLEPMSAYERKIIHTALQNHDKVKTFSKGEEPYRKVVITLK